MSYKVLAGLITGGFLLAMAPAHAGGRCVTVTLVMPAELGSKGWKLDVSTTTNWQQPMTQAEYQRSNAAACRGGSRITNGVVARVFIRSVGWTEARFQVFGRTPEGKMARYDRTLRFPGNPQTVAINRKDVTIR